MSDKTITTDLICKSCGKKLTENNSYERADGISDFCIDCEEQLYNELAQINGYSLALFFMCIKFNVPLFPLLIPDDFAEENFIGANGRWTWYNNTLFESEKNIKEDGSIVEFKDGETYLFRIFGRNLTATDFSQFCKYEKERLAKIAGTEKQRAMWGTRRLWQNLDMTNEIYQELDRRYETKMARYKGITMDEMLADTLKKICKLEVAQEYLQSIGDAGSFDKIQRSIDSILASEQLRKKDEKPVESLRLDAMVLALEKAGLMESGELLPYDELVKVLRDFTVKSKKYDYSLDVADQVILDVLNSMRANADEPLLTELEEKYAAVDEYGEFEPEETEREKENKKFAGLTKVQIAKSKRGS